MREYTRFTPPATGVVATIPDVLCAGLYRKLLHHFGDVAVANQGVPFVGRDVWNAVAGRNELHAEAFGEYYKVNCPFCSDTRKRLWVNHTFGQRNEQGHRRTHVVVCFNEDCTTDYENRNKLEEMLFGFRNANDPQRPESLTIKQGDVSLALRAAQPPGAIYDVDSLPEDHELFRYLIAQRGYSMDLLRYYGIGYVASAADWCRTAYNRVYIPIFMHEEYVGWQARYIGDANWKMVPKYYGMPGMSKGAMLYNFDRAKHKLYVVLVEGATDVWSIGDTAVALLGKTLTAAQRMLVLRTWAGKPIVLLLDPEAEANTLKITQELQLHHTGPVIPLQLPAGYDPGQLNQEANYNFIVAGAMQHGVNLEQVQ